VNDADEQPNAVQQVVEEGLFDRQLGGPVKEAKAPADHEGKKNVGRARVKALTPRCLKSRLRSVVVQLDKHVQEMGGGPPACRWNWALSRSTEKLWTKWSTRGIS
jgi:hypothetical protein